MNRLRLFGEGGGGALRGWADLDSGRVNNDLTGRRHLEVVKSLSYINVVRGAKGKISRQPRSIGSERQVI